MSKSVDVVNFGLVPCNVVLIKIYIKINFFLRNLFERSYLLFGFYLTYPRIKQISKVSWLIILSMLRVRLAEWSAIDLISRKQLIF